MSSVSTGVAFKDELIILEEVIVKTSRGNDEVTVIDIRDKMNPSVVGSLSVGTEPLGMATSNNLLYVIDSNVKDLKVINPCTLLLSFEPNNTTAFTQITSSDIDKQTLSLDNHTLSISNGNSVDLAGINTVQDVIEDNDSDTKIQVEESADEDVIRFD